MRFVLRDASGQWIDVPAIVDPEEQNHYYVEPPFSRHNVLYMAAPAAAGEPTRFLPVMRSDLDPAGGQAHFFVKFPDAPEAFHLSNMPADCRSDED
jgi:hypothetical protein